jgi:lytic murein transglycosylase
MFPPNFRIPQENFMRAVKTILASAALAAATLLATVTGASAAAKCGNTSAGFDNWVQDFKQQAQSRGVSASTLDKAFSGVKYNVPTIRADRGQHSFKLSFDQFMRKRGGASIISRGKQVKRANASLFAAIERRYGVPAGPLIAIWGMETGFGGFQGNQHTMSAVTTLAFDCRRSAFFTDQLYAALELVQKGYLSPSARGAAHGEIGQTQFLPRNVIRYGVSGDGNRSVDLIGSRADALASTANFLVGHGWQRGAGYQPGQANFSAIQGWNAAGVYQQAIAYIGQQIDGAQ